MNTMNMRHEPLVYELSRAGRRGCALPKSDVPEYALPGDLVREELDLPELDELTVVRHFTRLSQKNFSIDTEFYPLGSCTMKYNPKVNEVAASNPGWKNLHPLVGEEHAQGALELMWKLQEGLREIGGFAAASLQPAAGAHGELSGVLMIRAALRARGDDGRRKMLIPDSAHGTNPASCTMAGFVTQTIPSAPDGNIDMAALRSALDESVAGIMITNPNTLGLFEKNIEEICRLVHEAGGYVYGDGANMNALAGVARPGDFGVDVMHLNLHKTFSTPHGGGGPGSGPVAVKKHLEPFLPVPRLARRTDRWTFDYDRPQSLGRVKAFYGNFGVVVRALAYIMAHGGEGLLRATMDAVLNANYIRRKLAPHFELPHGEPSLHECVFSDARQAEHGVRTGDIAKRRIDFGFHPYTVSFPLIVHGAMMIEPTESESKRELDLFIEAMISIAREAEENPELVQNAPYLTRTAKVDEVAAARKPVLRWKP